MLYPLCISRIFSSECHPSQTVRLPLSSFELATQIFQDGVTLSSKPNLSIESSSNSHLLYTKKSVLQQQVTVKFHGVFTSHWKALASTPEEYVQ